MIRFLRQQATRWLFVMGFAEFVLLATAVALAMRVRYFADPAAYAGVSQHLLARSGLFAASILLGMFALGLYQAHMRESVAGMFLRQLVGFVLGAFFLVILYYVLPQAYIGRGVFGLAVLFGLITVVLCRVFFFNLMDAELLKRRVLVLGAGHRAEYLVKWNRRRSDRRTFKVVGFVPVAGETIAVPADEVLQIEGGLYAWAKREHIDEIVVGPDDRRGKVPMDALLECKQHGIEVTNLLRFLERESGKVKLSAYPSWLVFSEGFDGSHLRKASKRAFDIFCAVAVLLVTWPLMLLTALAIRIESGAGQPLLYRQERVGERGRVFRLIKFRSMRTDAERDGVARWASKNDDRVTRVGRFIRKTRLDELPQLWNVLKGDMSFIGPRPERPQFVDELAKKISYYTLRHCVKPGLTGWAQLRYPYGSSEEDAAEKLTFDLYYVKNHNLRFDLMIFLQTIEVVLFGRGAR